MRNTPTLFSSLMFVIIGVLLSCQPSPTAQTAPASQSAPIPKDWIKFNAHGRFTFSAPPDTKDEKAMGIDSLVGRYTSSTMAISFDYGWYSSPLDDPRYVREATKIDGRDGFLVHYFSFIGIYVPNVDGDPKNATKLEMSISYSSPSDQDALCVLRSIRFTPPATTRDSNTTRAP
jgi:hypothetical protein